MQHTKSWKTSAFVAALALSTTLAACSTDEGSDPTTDEGSVPEEGEALVVDGEEIADAELWAEARSDGFIDIYSSNPRSEGFLDAFQEDTGLEINLVTVTGSQMIERLRSEAGANTLPADVAFVSDPVQTGALFDEGIFESYCPVGWDAIPEELKDEDCGWWVAVQPVYTIVYNTEQIDEADAPTSWEDLLDPKWSDQITLPWIGNGGSTWARDLYLRTTFGIEYWEDLAANSPTIVSSSSQSLENVARGEYPVGMTVGGNIALAVRDGEGVRAVSPAEGIPAYSATVGYIADAEQSAAAQVFLNWMSSTRGQIAVGGTGDYPVRLDVPGPIDGAGGNLPSVSEAGLKFPETYPNYAADREAWIEEWLTIFDYNP